jgi:coenzyme F420-0:L-glutamate ligase/coenzyme F420-1:gamma-L-glutamate ligase
MSESHDRNPALWEGLATRRSIRLYRNKPVPTALVYQLLEVAGQAPSAHNRQPWRWAVVETEAIRQALADAMAIDFMRDLRQDGVAEETIMAMAERSRRRIGGAPLIVAPCLTMVDMDRYPDPARQIFEWQMAVQSVALACQNFMLAAHAVGLGSCWICAPLFCAETVITSLSLPADWEPQALITVGYPAAEGRIRPRHRVEDLTVFR